MSINSAPQDDARRKEEERRRNARLAAHKQRDNNPNMRGWLERMENQQRKSSKPFEEPLSE